MICTSVGARGAPVCGMVCTGECRALVHAVHQLVLSLGGGPAVLYCKGIGLRAVLQDITLAQQADVDQALEGLLDAALTKVCLG